jgi:hypothetical protein
MKPHQLDLCFAAAAAPLQEEAETELVLAYLQANPGFHTARVLSAALGLTDRQIRRAAELASGTIVSGPGSPGYCHITHCSLEQLDHIRNTLRSQARHMLRRYVNLGKRAHATIH